MADKTTKATKISGNEGRRINPANAKARREARSAVRTAKKAKERDACYMDNIPDEVLLEILSHVTVEDLVLRVPLVCRRFERLTQDTNLWKGQELQYRSFETDKEFARCLFVVPFVARLDLSGIKAGSMAEKAVMDDLPMNPPNQNGLELVLSDEMEPDVSVLLVERQLRSLVSLHVGPILFPPHSYVRLINLIEMAPRLRELRLRADMKKPPHYTRVVFAPANTDKVPCLRRLELGSPCGRMSKPALVAALRLIHVNHASLRSVSHEFMMSKRASNAKQELDVMDALVHCISLETTRVWSSHCVKGLEKVTTLRNLTLSCDGHCHERMDGAAGEPPVQMGAIIAFAIMEGQFGVHYVDAANGPPNEDPLNFQHGLHDEVFNGPIFGIPGGHDTDSSDDDVDSDSDTSDSEIDDDLLAALNFVVHADEGQQDAAIHQAVHEAEQAAQAVQQAVDAVEGAMGAHGAAAAGLENEAPFTCVELFTQSPLLPRLKRLCLRYLDCDKVTPLFHISSRCPGLEELTLKCSSVPDRHFNEQMKMLVNLRRLTLIGVHYLHSETLREWTADMLPILEKLTLIGACRFCPWVCWAGPIMELRARRPKLLIICKECEHFNQSHNVNS